MYETNEKNKNECREQELYRAAFSGFHASEKLKREDFYMKNNKTHGIRIGRMAFACMLVTLLLCMMSIAAFAATGGETVNPVNAVKICIDGKDAADKFTKQEDGSYYYKTEDAEKGESAEIRVQSEMWSAEDNDADAGLRIDIESEEEGE